jgi:hypothetical protein
MFGGLIALFAIGAATIVACPPIAVQFTPFSYASHERPRVFVSHHPLRAIPGQTVTIRLSPDLRPQDGAVVRAIAQLGPAGGAPQLETCAGLTDGTFACAFTLPAGDGDFVYSGHVELANNVRVSARTSYRFRAAATIGATEKLTLREPVKPLTDLTDAYRVDTAFVRDDPQARADLAHPADPAEIYPESDFLTDVEAAVYDGILLDPVYRWRDAQLAFYEFGRVGFTSSFYSGLDTRCGQNPWPADQRLSDELRDVEVIGVLHRHASAANGAEGEVQPAADLRGVFRDCAGDAVKSAPSDPSSAPKRRTFSTTGGRTATARTAKHELGHAAFFLGDEYSESNATRQVAAAPTPPIDPLRPFDGSCCCAVPDDGRPGGVGGGERTPGGGGPAIPGGARQVQCVQPGGGITTRAVIGTGGADGLPPCPATFAPQCGSQPQSDCPTLSGDCVAARIFNGQAPPDDERARPNTYRSKDACEAGRAAALVHPGVEDPPRTLGTCRQICGTTGNPCPCGQGEAWIVDTNAAVTTANAVDTMGAIAAERQGGTCAWCVETTLCLRWHEALGNSAADAWAVCAAPPQDAVAREHGFWGFVQWLNDFVRWITQHAHF